LLDSRNIDNEYDPNLLIINYKVDEISETKVLPLIKELASFNSYVKNVYYEINAPYQREFFMKTLDEYDFNQWKRIYNTSSFSSFIKEISNIIERLYISRYDDKIVELVKLKSMIKKIYSFIYFQNEYFSENNLDESKIINSLIVDDFSSFGDGNDKTIFVQIHSHQNKDVKKFINQIKEIFSRYEVSFSVSKTHLYNHSTPLYYQEFSDLEAYSNYASTLYESEFINKVFSILDHYNENNNFIQYQFLNRLKKVDGSKDAVINYLNSLEFLEEKLYEIKARYPMDAQLLLILDDLLGNDEDEGLFAQLKYVLHNASMVNEKYNKLNELFIKSLNEFISESRSMLAFDLDILPNETKLFYINNNRYVLRYY
tara:strand:- start:222 stop:1334 length:1113 start_codon:yes stop_codon:yes gene_type:complete